MDYTKEYGSDALKEPVLFVKTLNCLILDKEPIIYLKKLFETRTLNKVPFPQHINLVS
ncbi:MAG: hypothetical protein ACTSR8_02230 [Promethearchaeota archaeon]